MEKTDMSCSVEFGPGESVEIEYGRNRDAWISLGPVIEASDVWFTGHEGIPDIRVRILRLENELRIAADRGGQSPEWWPQGGEPAMRLLFDPGRRRVVATAGAGRGADFQEAELGEAKF